MINVREQIVELLSPNSIGCELGVFEGDFSQSLVDSNKFSELYLVDLFSGSASNFGKHYPDASILNEYVKKKFQSHSSVKVVKQDSISFLQTSKINFDFIYIDTIHTYHHLIQELNSAHDCIKPGGYICGHDYCIEFMGVIQAVKEFSTKYQYPVIVTTENDYPSFIIRVKI